MGCTILYVDDDEDVRESTEAILTLAGFRVLVAKGGYEAVRLLADNDLDVLFTDIVMPGIDGIELARLARQRRPGIKILFVTAYSSRIAEATELGRLIPKPLGRQQIIDGLGAVLAT